MIRSAFRTYKRLQYVLIAHAVLLNVYLTRTSVAQGGAGRSFDADAVVTWYFYDTTQLYKFNVRI
jgi:hypothetical protein